MTSSDAVVDGHNYADAELLVSGVCATEELEVTCKYDRELLRNGVSHVLRNAFFGKTRYAGWSVFRFRASSVGGLVFRKLPTTGVSELFRTSETSHPTGAAQLGASGAGTHAAWATIGRRL